MMQRKKGGYFIAQALGFMAYVHVMVYVLQNGKQLLHRGNHCHQLVFVSKILPGFIRSTNSITMLSFLWYNSVVIDATTILS